MFNPLSYVLGDDKFIRRANPLFAGDLDETEHYWSMLPDKNKHYVRSLPRFKQTPRVLYDGRGYCDLGVVCKLSGTGEFIMQEGVWFFRSNNGDVDQLLPPPALMEDYLFYDERSSLNFDVIPTHRIDKAVRLISEAAYFTSCRFGRHIKVVGTYYGANDILIPFSKLALFARLYPQCVFNLFKDEG